MAISFVLVGCKFGQSDGEGVLSYIESEPQRLRDVAILAAAKGWEFRDGGASLEETTNVVAEIFNRNFNIK